MQQFPGVFVDDIVVSTGEGSTVRGRRRADGRLDRAGRCVIRRGIEEPNRNDWVRRGGLGIKEGAVVKTPDTSYMGFGFRGHHRQGPNDVMKRSMDYLRR